MRESSVYQAILAEGFARGFAKGYLQGTRRALVSYATSQLGSPDRITRQALEAITDVAQLTELLHRVNRCHCWHDLLPTPPRRN